MSQKLHEIMGKSILCFSIIGALIIGYLSFKGEGDFNNLSNSNWKNDILVAAAMIFVLIGGYRMRDKYPHYYKYQIVSASILLTTIIIFSIIPRLLYNI